MFCIHFMSLLYIFGTNLLTRCHSASSCFLLFLYSRKASQEIFSELDENLRRHLFYQNTHGVQRGDEEEPGGPHTPLGRGPPPWRALGCCGPIGGRQPPPFRLLISPDAKTLRPEPISTKSSRGAAVVSPSSGGSRTSSRHPAGEGNHHRRALHHHACLRSDA